MFEKQQWMRTAYDYPKTEAEWFELLARAVFSAGLGPKVVAAKWNDITSNFFDWDVAKVALTKQAFVEDLLANAYVLRNRPKVEHVVENARIVYDMAGECRLGELVLDRVLRDGMDGAAEYLSKFFKGLGRTSALFFLFSAGLRTSPKDGFTDSPELVLPQAEPIVPTMRRLMVHVRGGLVQSIQADGEFPAVVYVLDQDNDKPAPVAFDVDVVAPAELDTELRTEGRVVGNMRDDFDAMRVGLECMVRVALPVTEGAIRPAQYVLYPVMGVEDSPHHSFAIINIDQRPISQVDLNEEEKH